MNSFCPGKNRYVVGFSLILFISVAIALLLELHYFLFCRGPTHGGGKVGRWIDNFIRRSIFELTSRRQNEEFDQRMGYALPSLSGNGANQVGVHVLLNSWLSHSLSRMMVRQDRANEYFLQNRSIKSLPEQCSTLKLVQPEFGNWFRPLDFSVASSNINETGNGDQWLREVEVLLFDEEQISCFFRENFELLYHAIFQKLNPFERIELFGLALISEFGGIFVSPNVQNLSWIHRTAPGFQLWVENFLNICTEKPVMWMQTSDDLGCIIVLASSPNHPKLHCPLKTIVSSSEYTDWQSLISLIRQTNWDTTCSSECCLINDMSGLPVSEDTFTVSVSDSTTLDRSDVEVAGSRFTVTISERSTNIPMTLRRRNRISDQLRIQHCSAGWLCNRCLRMPFTGTLLACKDVCRSCYSKIICTAPKRMKTTFINVKVVERLDIKEKRIPRIIHQTWLEDMSTDRYPYLQRLQNSWKASGWDYRFYTDNDCVLYIKKNFPVRFVEAYEAILPGAFKADFFRLLVLLKDGGIYADIDVQLEADLDNFITDDLSFFIPRDVPLDYWPDSNYCLWNGLMGSSPGNPILAKAVEDILFTIQNRYDYNDIERKLCYHDINAHIWKLRSLPILILTGPCSLGMSVNSAIGQHDLLSGHVLGWLKTQNVSADRQPKNYNWGNAFTLLADRNDLGELRFTDIHRNLLIASSDQDRITKTPISDGKPRIFNPSTHYSKSETDIVGEHGVYKDDIAFEENVKVVVFLEVTDALYTPPRLGI
jgi:Glycosyltransferase sugar-binding region containing DXD motif